MFRKATNAAVIVICLICAQVLRGEDTVVATRADNPNARITLAGEIVDYTGRELTLRLPGGGEKKIPSSLVVDVRTTLSPEQTAADELFAAGRYQAAIDKYLAAGRAENRRWVRQQILSRLVVCERELGHLAAAGDYFVSLVREDPQTPYFAVAPLAWVTTEPSASLEQKALGWLAREDAPAVVLLGASHLLTTSHRQAALERLAQLAAGDDPRVAPLAEAQRWRTSYVTASPEQVQAWRNVVERIPTAMRAGPYLVLGRALAHHKLPQDAAIALLHVPILHADQPQLASEALSLAAQSLERSNDREGSHRLLAELVTKYPNSTEAVLAREKLNTKGVVD